MQESSLVSCDESADLSTTKQFTEKSFANNLRKKLTTRIYLEVLPYMKMDVKAAIEPLLKKHKLVAFLINDGWLLIRRKEYIDIYIQKQPFSSVEFLFHIATKVKVTLKMYIYGITLIFCFRGFLFECGAEQLSMCRVVILLNN